jgi:ketosteroid isomerase-like protein
MINTVTKHTRLNYDQQYSWHCKFNEDGKIVSVRIYLDSVLTQDVLGAEKEAQQDVSC